MEDIKILKICGTCHKPLTLLESCRSDDSKTSYLVIKCLYCGDHPLEEIARLHEDQTKLY